MHSKSAAVKKGEEQETKAKKAIHYNIEIGKKLAETQVKQL